MELTPLQRATRTLGQGVIALVIHLPFLVLLPEVRSLIDEFPTILVTTVIALSAIVAYFQNKRDVGKEF